MSEKNTYNQVNEQQSSAYLNQSGANPTVLVKRTDGRISVGRLEMDGSRDVRFSDNGEKLAKKVSIESVSDLHQAKLAEELAGRALRGSGIDLDDQVSPEQQVALIDPIDQLPLSVREEVLTYRRVLQNKRESERDKRFAQAAEDGRLIYRVEQSLSIEAKHFLNLK